MSRRRSRIARASVPFFAIVGMAPIVRAERFLDPLLVRCRDLEGRVVKGAEVFVFQRERLPGSQDWIYGQHGPFVSNDEGTVICPRAITYDESKFDRFVYARLPGCLVGTTRSNSRYPAVDSTKSNCIDVILCPSRKVEGHVLVPEGSDPQVVRVRVHMLRVFDGTQVVAGVDRGNAFPREASFPGLSEALPSCFERQAGADGSFAFDDLPAGGQVYLLAEGKGLGQGQYGNVGRWGEPPPTIPEDVTMEMNREGVLVGRVVSPKNVPIVGGCISVQMERGPRSNVIKSMFTGHTDPAGRYRIGGLPEGEYVVRAEPPAGEVTMMPVPVSVRAGEESDASIEFETGTLVHGRVLDSQAKSPLAGVHVAAIRGNAPRAPIGHCSTNEEGRFELRLPRGRIDLYFSGIPRGYAYPSPRIVKSLTLTGEERLAALEFHLERKN